VSLPSGGSCGGQYTANTMACVSEAIGLALPGSSGPARALRGAVNAFAEKSGEAVMRLIKQGAGVRREHRHAEVAGETPPPWSPPPAVRPTPRCISRRWRTKAGIKFDLFDVAAIFRRHALYRQPEAGWEIHRQGSARCRRRRHRDPARCSNAGHIHGDCITVTGKTIADNVRGIKIPPEPGRGSFR